MSITVSTGLKASRSQQITALAGANATLKIYSGTKPASPDAAATGTLLSTLTGNASAFGSTITSGVNQVAVGTAGAGYTSAPTVSFSGGGGSGATAVAVISGGVVVGVTVTDPGTGYTSAPTVSFSGGGFTTAAAATAAVGVVLKVAAITSDPSAANSGTPGYCRISSSGGTAVLDLDVGGAGSAADMQLTPNTIVQGAPVSLSSFLINE